MAGQTLLAPGVARTERGLVVAGTRITLYAIIDRINYHGGNATNADIQERFVLSEQQVADVLAYIAAHREEVEAEYRQVLREAEELEQYYAERNREVLAGATRRGVTTVLLDANLTGLAAHLRSALQTSGWLQLVAMEFATFPDLDLPYSLHDRAIWRFVQERQMPLLADNRNMRGANSLERTLREELQPSSLPILTIGSSDRLEEREYRRQCIERLVEIVTDLENLRGTPRLFIP
jgi:uncharacterized protein (DUF433 family)